MLEGQTGEDWRDLCELAAKEQNSQKLMELVARITRALDEALHPQEGAVSSRIQ